MNPIQYLLSVIDKNPAMQSLVLIVAILSGVAMNALTLHKVDTFESMQYDYALQVFKYSIKDVKSSSDVLQLAEGWRDRSWGAQIAATNTLCTGPGRIALKNEVGADVIIDLCRIVS